MGERVRQDVVMSERKGRDVWVVAIHSEMQLAGVLVCKDREEALTVAEALKGMGRVLAWKAEEVYPFEG